MDKKPASKRLGSVKSAKFAKSQAPKQRTVPRHSDLSKFAKIQKTSHHVGTGSQRKTSKRPEKPPFDMEEIPASNISLNRQSFFRGSSIERSPHQPRLLSTKGMEPCSFMTRNGKVSITSQGFVELEFLRKERTVIISGDGLQVTIRSMKDGSEDNYKVEKMPLKYHQVYKYATEVINLINSKKPKWKFENKLGKFMLMKNQPFPNFEAYFKSGVVIVHQVTSDFLTIKNNGINRRVGLYNKDIEMLDAKLKTEVEAALKYLKFFIEQG